MASQLGKWQRVATSTSLNNCYLVCMFSFPIRSCDNTLEDCFFQLSSYLRAYLWLIYEKTKNRALSHDVTAAILVFQNNEMAAMLVYQTNPVGVELLSYANDFFCSNKFA